VSDSFFVNKKKTLLILTRDLLQENRGKMTLLQTQRNAKDEVERTINSSAKTTT
jgi:hypothetical protein